MSPFWIALIGSLPGAIVSIIVLLITLRNSRSLEGLKGNIQQDIVRFTRWHEKRIAALEAIYIAFVDYLDFLRRALYFERQGMDLTPMHEFRNILERQLIYLDHTMAEKIERYQGELLLFWNDAVMRGEKGREFVRHQLDFEIPGYLRQLREDINQFSDPNYRMERRPGGMTDGR